MIPRAFGEMFAEMVGVLQLPAPESEVMTDVSPLFAMYRAIGLVSLPLSPPEGPLSRSPCSLDSLECRQSYLPAIVGSLLPIPYVPV